MTPAPLHTPATIHVVNPDVEPTDAWVRAIAVMLLRDVDREREEMEAPLSTIGRKQNEEQDESRPGTTR